METTEGVSILREEVDINQIIQICVIYFLLFEPYASLSYLSGNLRYLGSFRHLKVEKTKNRLYVEERTKKWRKCLSQKVEEEKIQ